MVKQDVLIQNPTGLHARPAAQLINLCKNFPCSVKLEAEGKTCDAKSIFSVLKCAIRQGQTVSIVCDGEGEQEALEKVVAYIQGLTE